MDESYYSQIVLRIFLALIAGMVIGFDSWKNSRNASIRIYGVVSVSACMIIMLINFATSEHPEAFSRVLAGLITGLGFLVAALLCVPLILINYLVLQRLLQFGLAL